MTCRGELEEWKNEASVLISEYQWLIREEVPSQLNHLHSLLKDCSRRFPLRIQGVENIIKPDKFVISMATGKTDTNPSKEDIKCLVTMMGDNICHADIQLRLAKHHGAIFKSSIQHDNPWKLQQLQDAGNHLGEAIEALRQYGDSYFFQSGRQVYMVLSEITACLNRGRQCLIMPRRKTIHELQNSRNMNVITPQLPSDIALSFYIHSHKLMFAVYHVQQGTGGKTWDIHQGECLVPWLNESLAMLSVSLQMCQQLKDKMSVFEQYKDVRLPTTPIKTEDECTKSLT